MSKSKDEFPAWFLWIWEKGLLGILLFLIVFFAIVSLLAIYVDHRIQGLEQRLTFEPPSSYQPPNLDDFAAPDFDADAVVAEGTFYAPIYSHVYSAGGHPYLLEATLSIRNTNVDRPVFVRSVRYYDTGGKLAKTYVDQVIRLGPLETIEFVVEQHDTTGGSGANFIVDWAAVDQVNQPLVEAVMVGIRGTQGICFSRSAVPLVTP
jgi:hypothetical protein